MCSYCIWIRHHCHFHGFLMMSWTSSFHAEFFENHNKTCITANQQTENLDMNVYNEYAFHTEKLFIPWRSIVEGKLPVACEIPRQL